MSIELRPHIGRTSDGRTVDNNQDIILFEGRHVGYCVRKLGAPLNLIVRGLSESAVAQIVSALDERDGGEQSRAVSTIPPMVTGKTDE